MSTPLGSEPAYPLQITSALTGWTLANHGGLTKREFFAAMAMQGLLANQNTLELAVRKLATDEFYASYAVAAADALLVALQPTESPTHTEATPEPPNAR